jgi:DNA-binding response OmpR family regulator
MNRLQAWGCALIGYGPAETLSACFLAGCDDYLKDPWTPEELGWRVRKNCPSPGSLFRLTWGSFEIGSLELKTSGGSCRLCTQERSVLRMLAVNAGEAVSREALYYGMWGKPPPAGSRAADMHIASLRKKLRRLFPATRGCIRSVRGIGYLMVR